LAGDELPVNEVAIGTIIPADRFLERSTRALTSAHAKPLAESGSRRRHLTRGSVETVRNQTQVAALASTYRDQVPRARFSISASRLLGLKLQAVKINMPID
jgi:hypothetical protein